MIPEKSTASLWRLQPYDCSVTFCPSCSSSLIVYYKLMLIHPSRKGPQQQHNFSFCYLRTFPSLTAAVGPFDLGPCVEWEPPSLDSCFWSLTLIVFPNPFPTSHPPLVVLGCPARGPARASSAPARRSATTPSPRPRAPASARWGRCGRPGEAHPRVGRVSAVVTQGAG